MGYTTDFDGQFELTPALTSAQRDYLQKFSETRRVRRRAAQTEKRPDPVRLAVGLPVGLEGGYFVGEDGFMGQNESADTINYNSPPQGQPGLWCQWVPSENGQHLEWNGTEKFYSYVEWLEYIIKHFLKPWKVTCNGEVKWQGEDPSDIGKIIVKDNKVSTKQGVVRYV